MTTVDFRNSYVRFHEVESQMRAWQMQYPDLVSLKSLGKTEEGRDLWLLIVGRNHHELRPAVWIDGNMHATEVAGTSVALAVAEDAIRLLQDPNASVDIRDTIFYIVPRISPDGAEAVLESGIYKRSVPRNAVAKMAAHWRLADVNNDGLVHYMRVLDRCGDFSGHPNDPELLVPRELGDTGPFYKLYPEGFIENFDGDHVPAPHYLSDNGPDLNRNFPFHWRSEREQIGAGSFPGSEPESRAILEFVTAHPNIYAWLNLHTFGGCFIRPPGDRADEKMPPYDLAIYRELGDIAEANTRYPMVSGYREFLYEPDKPLHGALSEWAYEERGAFASVCELWDLFAELGIARPAKFVDFYTKLDRAQMLRFKAWDREKNHGRIFVKWQKVTHPQLGEVGVGGIDRREGLFNPPRERLAEICSGQSAFVMELAKRCPRVEMNVVCTKSGSTTNVVVTCENVGYWPLYGTAGSKSHPWNEAPRLQLELEGELKLAGQADKRVAHIQGRHLEGWGRGKDTFSAFHPDATGSSSRWVSRHIVEGTGKLTVTLKTARAGNVSRSVAIE